MRDFVVVGLSHRTAPVEVREKLAVGPNELRTVLENVANDPHFDEAVLISTCNRVELYTTSAQPADAVRRATETLAERLPADSSVDVLYQRRGIEVVRHAFRVASSLDSLVVGEPQILGQVKDAFAVAQEAGTVGTLLGKCFTQSFRAAKRIRTETGIAEGTVSVSSIACELAQKIFGQLAGRRALLLGAGEMGEAAARSLRDMGAQLHVVNRSEQRALLLAEQCGGRAVPYEQLAVELAGADVVVASTSSPKFVLTPELMQGVARTRRHRPLFIIDIAVPRDVDPRIANMDNVFVYDVDDLQQVAEENMAVRERETLLAERIVAEEVEAFLAWRRSLDLAPTIVALREKFNRLAETELQRVLPRLSNLSPDDRAVLEGMSRSLIAKLLHPPMAQLKAGAVEADGALLIDAVRRLFELELQGRTEIEEETASSHKPALLAATASTGESK
jgi:glutamyl-tRNA reductase